MKRVQSWSCDKLAKLPNCGE